jgi:hypothetical protein
VDAVTDADGRFEAWFELSPGPVNIQVDVSGTEVKVRKHDEMAQFGSVWSSDIGRMGRIFPDGIINDYLNEMAVTTPSGHNIVIATGAAIIHGHIFSIENGPMTIVGTANTNPAIDPRLDLVTLRQYHETAAGQDSGRQEVVVTLGTSSDVAPATPTGADFTDLPLAVVSTAHLAASKTLDEDLREYVTPAISELAPNITRINGVGGVGLTTSYVTRHTFSVTGLNPDRTYDGEVTLQYYVVTASGSGSNTMDIDITSPYAYGGVQEVTGVLPVQALASVNNQNLSYTIPLVGVTGVEDFTFDVRLKKLVTNPGITLTGWDHFLVLRPRR